MADTSFRTTTDARGLPPAENTFYTKNCADTAPLRSDQERVRKNSSALINRKCLQQIPSDSRIADVAVWLASPEASYITGEIINVDCGFFLASGLPDLDSIRRY
jgi:NAD(P)-dependent dehydrogenase (short-subunit alcohol dehydrogenase family)